MIRFDRPIFLGPYTLGLLLMFSFFLPHSLRAQAEERITDFSRPGRPTMMLYVWGTASTPGIWKVEQGVDLIELLSAAQIPNVGSVDQAKKQRMYLRIYRNNGGRRVQIYDAEIKQLITDSANYPALQNGDILFLETITRDRFNLQTVFSAIGAAASLTLLIIRINQL